MKNKNKSVELADIFASRANAFLSSKKYCSNQKSAYQAILNCRTAALGGHISKCDNCEHQKQAYNSCRNRNCPKCQLVKKAKWVDKLSGNLPPVKYFHIVFTIPTCLHQLFYTNQEVAYDLLFKTAGKALCKSAENNQYLGAKAGAVGILHTWGQRLVYHPHIHMIVPAGGLTEDGSEWIPSHKKFFVPVKSMSLIFRGLLCKEIETAIGKGKIKLPADYPNYQELKNQCYQKNWVVYCEKPFSSPENLINYLGNYTHRVAISNQRIVAHENGKVTFSFKDYKQAGIRKTMTLEEDEFIRRFMQHVLPKRFSKIRYFGFLALRFLQSNLEKCVQNLNKEIALPKLVGLNTMEVVRELFGIDPICCPKCQKGRLVLLFNNNKAPT